MILPGVMLGLGAAVAWGIGDLSGGLAARRASWLAVAAGAQLVGFLLLATTLVALGPPAPSASTVILGAIGGIFGGIGLAALYRSLAIGSMGLVSAISGSGGVLLPLAVGVLLLRQPVGAWQLVGVGCAVIALTIAGGGQRSGLSRRGLALALVAAVGFGLWFIFLERAALDGQLWALVSARGAATVFLGVPALLRGGAGSMRAARGLVLLAGATDVAANGLVVLAFPSVGVGIAAALSGMYPISTMLLARLLLGDRLPRQGQAAVLLAVAGVVLISLGG